MDCITNKKNGSQSEVKTPNKMTNAERVRKWRLENQDKAKKLREKEAEAKRVKRLDEIYRRDEQRRNTYQHIQRRRDLEFRKEEQLKDTNHHREKRLDAEFRQREQL